VVQKHYAKLTAREEQKLDVVLADQKFLATRIRTGLTAGLLDDWESIRTARGARALGLAK
jgi:hypothetical protein